MQQQFQIIRKLLSGAPVTDIKNRCHIIMSGSTSVLDRCAFLVVYDERRQQLIWCLYKEERLFSLMNLVFKEVLSAMCTAYSIQHADEKKKINITIARAC